MATKQELEKIFLDCEKRMENKITGLIAALRKEMMSKIDSIGKKIYSQKKVLDGLSSKITKIEDKVTGIQAVNEEIIKKIIPGIEIVGS